MDNDKLDPMELELDELAEVDPPAGTAVEEELAEEPYDPANAGDVIGGAPDSRGWLSRLGSGMASGISSTGRFLWDIPSRVSRPQMPQLRGAIPDPPLGARQVSPGYADDLWQARPTIDRPYPVILIHGTISSKNVWQNLVLRLREDDFVVFSPDYGVHGTQDIPTSAQDIGAYIEQVLAATGAEAVDIVGHSQGGLLARYWINELGGEDYVHHLITLGTPHQGTTLLGMLGSMLTTDMSQRVAAATIRRVFGAAGMQQVIGSPLLETLAASPETRNHIRYTCYATRNDATVVPHENAFLGDRKPLIPGDDEGERLADSTSDGDSGEAIVTNYFLQDLGVSKCKHEELPTNPDVQDIVHLALLDGLEEHDTEV
ncbi:alpha/beta fold hydrolase [Corynebacterium macclintockiae]|nr:alpha/beta fold hydrolase [Corynebacterium macclintockiae]